MRIFICILALAVASSKAGNASSASSDNDSKESSSQEGFDYAAPAAHNFAVQGQGNGDGGQSHIFSGGEGHNNYGQQLSGQNHDFSGNSQHFPSAESGNLISHLNQIHSISQMGNAFPQMQHLQSRGFDVGHTGFGGSGFQGDSYLQAAQELGSFNHGAHNGNSGNHEQQQSGSEEQSDHFPSLGHQGDEHGQGNAGNVQMFILQDGGQEFGHGDTQNFIEEGHQDFGNSGYGQDFGHQGYGHDFGGQGYGHDFGSQGHGQDFGHAETFDVGEHVDVEHPVKIPHYKHVTYPIPKHIQVNVPKPILVGVPQPYPVKVPVHKPVAVPVHTEINIPIEKVVPYPIIKNVPYPVEKKVPFKVEKAVTVHVPQPYPVKIPIYKTIHHYKDH